MTRDVLKLVLRRYLIAGLLVWLPIIATVLVVRFILDLMDQTLLLLPRGLRPEAWLGVDIPGLGALLAVLLLLATGLLVTNIIGRNLVRAWEDLLNRIPFVRAVYGGVKSFSTTILSNSGNSFKKVLLIEYPRAGIWSIGFQTASDVRLSSAQGDEPQVCVFVPTTPNPTSGFIMLLPRSQVVELDLSVDAAMKMIVTLGVVVPPPHATIAPQAPATASAATSLPVAPSH
ncbi:MAG TPA: DUF502 domain-containing protein [Steroidobacteraceae bacterium]